MEIISCFSQRQDLTSVRPKTIFFQKTSQTQGWDEKWQYLPSPLTMTGQQMFNPAIPECVGARWIQLDYVGSDQKSTFAAHLSASARTTVTKPCFSDRKCSDCYDFCLPDYGIEKDTVRNEEQLNIVKRICFYLFVPEWRTYAQANNIEQVRSGSSQMVCKQYDGMFLAETK